MGSVAGLLPESSVPHLLQGFVLLLNIRGNLPHCQPLTASCGFQKV